MLSKLIKHEFRATSRIMWPVFLGMLALTALMRFSQLLLNGGHIPWLLQLIGVLLVIGFVMGLFALAFAPLEWVYYTSAILIGFGFGIFIPTFQTMKLNMADRGHRGAVNSTFFTAFDIGVGTGMFFGGKIYAYLNLNWAFGAGALLNLLAIVYFYRISLDHYRKNKLGVDSD